MPDVAAYDALIFLGGPMSVNDDLPYLAQEMEWIRQAVEQAPAYPWHLPGRAVDRARDGRCGALQSG